MPKTYKAMKELSKVTPNQIGRPTYKDYNDLVEAVQEIQEIVRLQAEEIQRLYNLKDKDKLIRKATEPSNFPSDKLEDIKPWGKAESTTGKWDSPQEPRLKSDYSRFYVNGVRVYPIAELRDKLPIWFNAPGTGTEPGEFLDWLEKEGK